MINSNRSAQVRRLNRAVTAMFEGLEKRVCLDATPQSLPYSQNWTADLITVNDDWSGVPGVIGYRGDDLTTATGTDPQTILAPGVDGGDTPAGVPDVVANIATPNTNSTGGVGELEVTDRSIALQGSGTADAPFVLFHVNSTGVANVKVSYNVRDMDGSADNAIQQVALQFRVGNTGNFTNVAAGYVPDATLGGSATLVTPVSVTLPSIAGNQANLQIRMITTNAVGNDEWVGIDDVVIESGPASNGTFLFSSANYQVNEGAGTATIRVNRDGGTAGAVSVLFETITGGTATAGADYTVASQVINFADGVSFVDVPLPAITNDSDAEGAETVLVRLSNATGGATLGSAGQINSTLTIIDNDSAAPTVVLNEVSVQLPDTDNPYEFAEIRGTTTGNLFNTYFASVEGDQSSNPGNISFIQDLTSFQLGSNGLLLIRSASGHASQDGATTVINAAGLDNPGGGLQNGANSFLVIFSPVPLTNGTDLDTNNDGNLDLSPGASLIDGVGWVTGAAPLDRAYGTLLTLGGIDGNAPPDAAVRFPDNTTPLNGDAWYFGDTTDITGQDGENFDLDFFGNTLTTTNPNGLPAGTPLLTPGASNYPSTDTTAPTVAGDYLFDSDPPAYRLSFSEAIVGLTASDILLTNLTTASVVPTANIVVTPAGGNDFDVTFTVNPNGAIADGNYELSLAAGSVEDTAGNDLAASNLSFFVFAGDGDRTRTVDIDDFGDVAANFNAPGTFSQGDYDYSGVVDIDDFGILAAKFNQSLPAARPGVAPAGGAVAPATGKGIFADRLINPLLDAVKDDVIA